MNYQSQLQSAEADQSLSAAAKANIEHWLNNAKYKEYQSAIEQMIDQEQWQVLEDTFFQVLPFGTGGRRGTVGIGSNRINRVTIGESAQGMAEYVMAANKTAKQQGAVIAYDTRLTSVEFAELTASVFAANGFKVYLFENFRATPELSFAVRHLKAAAGVVISASHNPPSDNGFKAYWSDGGQIVPPHDKGIIEAVSRVTEIKTTDFTAAVTEGRVTMIGAEMDAAYVAAVVAESLSPSRSVSLAYSPLHGTGSRSALSVLQAAGFSNLIIVTEQAEPDGHFPNIKNNIPNPEVRDASDLVTEYAKKHDADLAITTDPDADRLGVVARDRAGAYQFLTGNQIAALIGYYVLSKLKAAGKLTPKHFVTKTIVTTDFITAEAADFGVKIYDNLLIGFKYIAELIRVKEGEEIFVFGGEESHGILKGDYTRDKDAAVAALLISEFASEQKDQGKTLIDALDDLYRRYGVYWETLENIAYKGAEGSATMAKLMKGLRAQPPQQIGNHAVTKSIDRLDPASEGTKGDVLIYHLSDDGQTRVTVRPSGTEPKLKVYAQVHVPLASDASNEALAAAKEQAAATATDITQALTDHFQEILEVK